MARGERLYLEVVRGERRGPLAAAARLLLALLALAFRLAVRLRGWAYDAGLRRAARARVPVLSVGNLTVGGTGKTPLVVHLARALLARGERPAVVARGYGARAPGAGAPAGALNDELAVVAREAPGALVVADRDRVAGAAAAEDAGATVVVLDDGFQHRRLARDVDVVVLDATAPWGPAGLLPRGLLREPRAALRRASVVVLSRLELAPAGARSRLEAEVRAAGFRGPVVAAVTTPAALTPLAGRAAPTDEPPAALAGAAVVAACGLANPAAFAATLERLGARVLALEALPDHHAWTAADVARVAARARDLGAARVVVTTKDAVKLGPDLLAAAGGPPWSALAIAVTLDPPAATGDIIGTLLRARVAPPPGAPRV